jgi:flavorubredoxin
MILDPGGHKVYSKVLGATFSVLGKAQLKYLFLSHQDPDIVAATNGWLMTTDAEAWVSALWTRFVPHFGLDHLVETRLKSIPDEGMFLQLGSTKLMVIPAHFLHSEGNFQLYDPVSKILYTGDLGASIGQNYIEVTDFDDHIAKYSLGFHKRYMCSGRSMRAWAKMVRQLDISIIAPQHGALFRGPHVQKFIDWCEKLECGVDLMDDVYKLPKA